MLRLLADENFNNQIIRGILRQNPNVNIVWVQDVVKILRKEKNLKLIHSGLLTLSNLLYLAIAATVKTSINRRHTIND